MRIFDAVLAIVQYSLSLFYWNGPELSAEVHRLQLSHVITPSNGLFSLNKEARVRVSADLGERLRSSERLIPQFKHHRDKESVTEFWRSEVGLLSQPSLPSRNDPREWRVSRQFVPDVTDKETVLTLAKIAANAYVPTPHEGDWSDVNDTDSGSWSHDKEGYGWDDDGLRGYVFTSEDNKTVVLSIKGTSAAVMDNGGPTAPNDKINDNLFFSCCCARVTRLWSTVCDCYLGDGQCDEQCLERELLREDRYYSQVLGVYDRLKEIAPQATNIWVTGHSLGGALSSMLGRTYGLPVVTFEAPGENLAVRRLHLPVPPGLPPWEEYVWHFGHNADPIYMGTCSGSGSTCWLRGYAMETKCHTGQICLYDVKKDLGWHDSIVNHRIHVVIDNVLEAYDEPALCVTPGACEDCTDWEFIDPLDVPISDPTSSTKTKSKSTKSSSTAKISTTTKVSTTPSTTTTHTTSTEELTSSCLTRVWYGRCDSWTTYPADRPTTSTSSKPPPKTTVSCTERKWFGVCEGWVTTTVEAKQTGV